MSSSSKLQFILLVSCVSLSMLGVSLAYENPLSPLASLLIASPEDVVTCPVPQNRCGSECDRRCSATSHKSACLMFCNLCCNKCLCVPPGTFGQKECCPCYNNWKTQQGGPKCP